MGRVRKLSRDALATHLGSEPARGSEISDVQSLYNMYHHRFDKKKGIEFLLEYLTGDDRKIVSLVNPKEISPTICWIARLLSLECKIPAETKDFFEKNVKKIVSNNSNLLNESETKVTKFKKYDPILGDLEEEVDRYINDNSYKFPKDMFVKRSPSKATLGLIISNYRAWLNEIDSIDTNPDVAEAYASKSEEYIVGLMDFLSDIISSAEEILTGNKTAVVRVPKVKTPEQIVAKVKYAKEYLTYKSLDPKKIIGSNFVVMVHVRYGYAGVFFAKENGVLSIEGTKLVGFDESRAFDKRLKKPEEALALLGRGNAKAVEKAFQSLPNKAGKKPVFYFSDDWMIFRAG